MSAAEMRADLEAAIRGEYEYIGDSEPILALLDRIEAVRALHHVADTIANHCVECFDPWPCPTIRALDGMP